MGQIYWSYQEEIEREKESAVKCEVWTSQVDHWGQDRDQQGDFVGESQRI